MAQAEQHTRRWPRLLRRFLIVLAFIIIIALVSFVVWASSTNPLMAEAEAALQDTASVDVSEEAFISFMPQGDAPDTGLILYPGGRVQPGAYAPLASAIAEQGYYAAIVYAPLNLAFFDTDAALKVIEAHPEVAHWAVGGHSLGGVAASLFVSNHPQLVDGLLFIGSYPVNDELAQYEDLEVVSLYGTTDGLADMDTILASAENLPADTQFIAIEGGNHAQFGYYGDQAGDNPAAISREEQQAQVLEAAIQLLSRIEAER